MRIIGVTDPGGRTAGTLSCRSLAPGGMAQGRTKVPAETADKRFPVLRRGQSRYCVRAALLLSSSRSMGRWKIQLLAAAAIVVGTWLQTELGAFDETDSGLSACIQGAVKAVRQSCSSQQGNLCWAWRSLGFL